MRKTAFIVFLILFSMASHAQRAGFSLNYNNFMTEPSFQGGGIDFILDVPLSKSVFADVSAGFDMIRHDSFTGNNNTPAVEAHDYTLFNAEISLNATLFQGKNFRTYLGAGYQFFHHFYKIDSAKATSIVRSGLFTQLGTDINPYDGSNWCLRAEIRPGMCFSNSKHMKYESYFGDQFFFIYASVGILFKSNFITLPQKIDCYDSF